MGSAEITVDLPLPAASPPPAAAGRRSRLSWILGIVALLTAAALIVLRRYRSERQSSALPELDEATVPNRPAQADLEDETMFISDLEAPEPAPKAMLRVIHSQSLDEGRTFELATGTNKIGRGEKNDVALTEKSVSRKHAEIYHNGRHYCLRDLGSKFGTLVDGRRLSSEITNLVHGARIELGPKTAFEFQMAAAPPDDPSVQTKVVEETVLIDPPKDAGHTIRRTLKTDDETVKIKS